MNTRSLLWGMLLAGIVLGAAPGALWAAAPELPEGLGAPASDTAEPPLPAGLGGETGAEQTTDRSAAAALPFRLRGFWEAFLGRPANTDLRRNRPVVGGRGIDELETTTHFTLHADAGP